MKFPLFDGKWFFLSVLLLIPTLLGAQSPLPEHKAQVLLERQRSEEVPVHWNEAVKKLMAATEQEILKSLEQQPLGMETALALVWKRHPHLNMMRRQWDAAIQEYSQLEGLMDTLGVYGQYLSQPTGMGNNSKETLQQQYPFPGVLSLQNKITAMDITEASVMYQIELRDLWIEVQNLYFEAQFEQERLSAIQENLQLLSNIHKTISSNYSTGKNSFSEVLSIEVQREELEEERKTVQDELETLRAKLDSMMNFPTLLSWQWKYDAAHAEPSVNQKISVPEVNEQELTLQLKQIRFQRLEQLVALEKEVLIPGLSPALALSNPLSSNEMKTTSMAETPPPSAFFGQGAAYLKELQLKQDAAKYEYEAEKNRLFVEIQEVVRDVNKGLREVTLYKQTILPKAKQVIQVGTAEYASGKTDLVMLLRSQETLLQLQTQFHAAHRMVLEKQLQLRKLLGQSVLSEGHEALSQEHHDLDSL
ncbi:TolC family protein [Deltaproteobacteria bacterium TL4]